MWEPRAYQAAPAPRICSDDTPVHLLNALFVLLQDVKSPNVLIGADFTAKIAVRRHPLPSLSVQHPLQCGNQCWGGSGAVWPLHSVEHAAMSSQPHPHRMWAWPSCRTGTTSARSLRRSAPSPGR